VKNKFRAWGMDREGLVLTKKPLVADAIECEHNPRSRSAKLRAIERVR